MTDEINLTGPQAPPADQGQQPTEPRPQTPFGPIPVGKVVTQKVRKRDGIIKDITVRVINPHTDSKHAT